MGKMIWGLDVGSNSLGWGVLQADDDGVLQQIIDAGVRIFPKAVEEKTPTPKNQHRRNARLARRTIQRRARRKQKLLNYLASLNLLPQALVKGDSFEGVLNGLGDPYTLRAKALDHDLTPHELGRVLLHLVQRRGFLSNKKTLLGRDMLDDPDVLAVLGESGEHEASDAEESAFKQDINQLRDTIKAGGFRTLGEYLASRSGHETKRNRQGQHLRTDRQMYQEELAQIFARQRHVHMQLTEEVERRIEQIIFHQRPLKLNPDRVGKCKLEPRHKRAAIARLEYQRFRYWQDINNLEYFDPYAEQWKRLSQEDRQHLAELFEQTESPTFTKIRKTLGFDKKTEFNLDSGVKKLRGNTTACAIRDVYPEWGDFSDEQQQALVEDMLTIKKKSALKQRLMKHWVVDGETAVKLCMVEFEPDYGSHSLKAIKRLLPHLEAGKIYSEARVEAGYGYEVEKPEVQDRLGTPPELPNPIVNKALHELKRVINALIAEYGRPDVIRIEMARDLEMNTTRYKRFVAQQQKNTKANDKATEVYQQIANEHPGLQLSKYPSKEMKLRYRLWNDQNFCCAYSNQQINLATLFSADIEVDHILPYSQSLDDSYMNKVVCFARENQIKGNKTPIDAFGANTEKWEQITAAISRWPKNFARKRERFYQRAEDLLQGRDFINNQLTDTRYIAKEAHTYLKTLGVDITFTRGVMTDWLRHQWQLNDLIGETDKKERTDHRHHTIDAVVTACIDRRLYNSLVKQSRELERSQTNLTMKDLYYDPVIPDIKAQLREVLDRLVVSYVSEKKIKDSFHEDSGVGHIQKDDQEYTVYRHRLNEKFTLKRAEKIVDEKVKDIVTAHLKKHENDPKSAFAETFQLFHQDGKTPIRRVRVTQAKVTLNELNKNRLPVKDKDGQVFKWLKYGNFHHADIFCHQDKPNEYKTVMVHMMQMAEWQRVPKGVSQRKRADPPSADWNYFMSLHAGDLVELEVKDEVCVYKILSFEADGRINARLHTDAIKTKRDIRMQVKDMIKQLNMKLLKVNAIGKPF